MPNIFNGQVIGLSKTSGGTPSAFCRAVSGGTFSRNPNNVVKGGIGGQRHVRKGADEVSLDWTCVGPAKTDLALWFPTTVGVQVASFPDFLVEVDDGSNGCELVVSGGQPASCTISVGEGPDAEVEYSFSAKFTTATEQAVGTDVAVYNSVLGHTINDITVQQAAADYGILSFELRGDLGIAMVNAMDTKASDSQTIPTAYAITKQDVTFTCSSTDEWQLDSMDGDTWTAGDIVITMANGTGAEDITITLDDFVPDEFNMPLEAEDIEKFGHSFIPGAGTAYNRVQIS